MPLKNHSTKSYRDYRKAFMESLKEYNRPVESLLGNKSRWVLVKPAQVESYLVFIPDAVWPPPNLDKYLILAQGPNLNQQQINLVKKLVFDPASYYNGSPVFRRLPHKPEFALRWRRDGEILDLLIDLHNPGWDFLCGKEQLSGWNWVEDELIDLAKAVAAVGGWGMEKHRRGLRTSTSDSGARSEPNDSLFYRPTFGYNELAVVKRVHSPHSPHALCAGLQSPCP